MLSARLPEKPAKRNWPIDHPTNQLASSQFLLTQEQK